MASYRNFYYTGPHSTYYNESPTLFIRPVGDYTIGGSTCVPVSLSNVVVRYPSFPSAFKIVSHNDDVNKIRIGKDSRTLFVSSWYCLFDDLTPAYLKVHNLQGNGVGVSNACVIANPDIIYSDHVWFVNMIRKCFKLGYANDPDAIIWDKELLKKFFVSPSVPKDVNSFDDDIYNFLTTHNPF